MPRYLVERDYGEELSVDKAAVDGIVAVNDEEGVHWLYSFVTADKKRSYCLMEGPNPEAVAEAARRNNIPADMIIEVGQLHPEQFV